MQSATPSEPDILISSIRAARTKLRMMMVVLALVLNAVMRRGIVRVCTVECMLQMGSGRWYCVNEAMFGDSSVSSAFSFDSYFLFRSVSRYHVLPCRYEGSLSHHLPYSSSSIYLVKPRLKHLYMNSGYGIRCIKVSHADFPSSFHCKVIRP